MRLFRIKVVFEYHPVGYFNSVGVNFPESFRKQKFYGSEGLHVKLQKWEPEGIHGQLLRL